ncbi:hypothetical protein MASSI9I_50804 [Massilia sp. 9I]|nr:hypothetical protein MASSI9I_50804 [Massilia sp. 9I]
MRYDVSRFLIDQRIDHHPGAAIAGITDYDFSPDGDPAYTRFDCDGAACRPMLTRPNHNKPAHRPGIQQETLCPLCAPHPRSARSPS